MAVKGFDHMVRGVTKSVTGEPVVVGTRAWLCLAMALTNGGRQDAESMDHRCHDRLLFFAQASPVGFPSPREFAKAG